MDLSHLTKLRILALMGIFRVHLHNLWSEEKLNLERTEWLDTIRMSFIRRWSISFFVNLSGEIYVHLLFFLFLKNDAAIFRLLEIVNLISFSPLLFTTPLPYGPMLPEGYELIPIFAFQSPNTIL